MIEPDENDVHSTKLSSSFMLFCPIVPILMLPLAVTDEVIEVIVVNLVDPTAVFEDATPVICSVTVDPIAFVPVTVNVFPVSPAEQYIHSLVIHLGLVFQRLQDYWKYINYHRR